MRVLVCGSRTFPEENIVWGFLSGLYQMHECGWMTVDMTPFTVIEGGATGADKWAETWVKNGPMHGPLVGQPNPFEACPVEHLPFPANWELHGKAAGPIRNTQMLNEGKPELVLAFVDKPLAESRGTADMVRKAKGFGVPTYVIEKVN